MMKTVLITGASSGIGKATAIRLAREKKFRLILCARRKERLEELAQYIESEYRIPTLVLCFDIRKEASVERAIDSIPVEWQDVDVLLNNAGLALGLDPIHEGNTDHWNTMIDTNIKGLIYITRLISRRMVAKKSGQIINICSTAGKEVYPKGNVYCATKFGVDALTRAIRQDLYLYNIRVGQVSPGHVEETEFAINRFEGDVVKADIYKDFTPLKSSDVADAIYFMVSAPGHVNILDIVMTSSQQGSATLVDRSGRKSYD
ncbi:MAG: SDR family NAD(P)-dependent oxidoreductase [Saprospiraceae bacterium]|nr:SDR family NAD(P)-dependent oxidoreductase [Saprospiraceae bacterium]